MARINKIQKYCPKCKMSVNAYKEYPYCELGYLDSFIGIYAVVWLIEYFIALIKPYRCSICESTNLEDISEKHEVKCNEL